MARLAFGTQPKDDDTMEGDIRYLRDTLAALRARPTALRPNLAGFLTMPR